MKTESERLSNGFHFVLRCDWNKKKLNDKDDAACNERSLLLEGEIELDVLLNWIMKKVLWEVLEEKQSF